MIFFICFREVIDRPVEVPVPVDREVIKEVPVREEVRVPVEVPVHVEVEKRVEVPVEVPVYIQGEPEVRLFCVRTVADLLASVKYKINFPENFMQASM